MEVAKLYGNLNKYAYYFTELLIGSPDPQRTSVIIDTGSRLVGFPCKGCGEKCGDHIFPRFDFSRSVTARWVTCADGYTCDTCDDEHCAYAEKYSEGSAISGRWFGDWVELGGSLNKNAPVRAHLGCHNMENKLFYTQAANGIMGLSPTNVGSAPGRAGNATRPSVSVLQDLFKDKKHINTKMFAICLATWGGQFAVGNYNDSYHTQPVQWTTLHAWDYYFVGPSGMALRSPEGHLTPINITRKDFGPTIIDSGTTYTFFPPAVYNTLKQMIDNYCANKGCGAANDGECFHPYDGLEKFPDVVFNFQDGVSTRWSGRQYLREKGLGSNIWCRAFASNSMPQTILGISWMLHKDIVFDIEGGRVGIAPADCPEHRMNADIIQKVEALAPAIGLPWTPSASTASSAFWFGAFTAFAGAGWVAFKLRREVQLPGVLLPVVESQAVGDHTAEAREDYQAVRMLHL